MSASYHHGDLRNAILACAAQAVVDHGPNHLSLRALAREAGVSHTAPRHHFGDKLGVTTALATQGYRLMGEASRAGYASGGLLGMGVAYVQFAREHRGHFQVMFQPDLVRPDEDLRRSADELYQMLMDAVRREAPSEDPELGTIRRWSTAHGLATLATSGTLSELSDDDLAELTRRVLSGLADATARSV